jgi:hypothetical protein
MRDIPLYTSCMKFIEFCEFFKIVFTILEVVASVITLICIVVEVPNYVIGSYYNTSSTRLILFSGGYILNDL